jgi:hypothetical protein
MRHDFKLDTTRHCVHNRKASAAVGAVLVVGQQLRASPVGAGAVRATSRDEVTHSLDKRLERAPWIWTPENVGVGRGAYILELDETQFSKCRDTLESLWPAVVGVGGACGVGEGMKGELFHRFCTAEKWPKKMQC